MSGSDRADVLLVGGGVASVRCARTLRRRGFDGSILLVGAERVAPYNRPPLSKELLRDDLSDELVFAEAESWYARRGIERRLGVRVTALDPAAHAATLDDGTTLGYGRCLLATGAEPRTLPLPGAEDGLLLRTLPDARRLRAAAVAADPGAPVTVVGGGFIGIEVASGLAALGLRPTIVEMRDALWGGSLGTELDRWARAALAGAGVTVRLGAGLTRLEPDAAWIEAERLPHAFAIAGIGVAPRTEIAEAAGLAVDDGVVTDAEHRTTAPDVWAAGDVARVAGRRVEHWHAAREGGERVALSMLAAEVSPPRASWVFSEIAGIPIDVIGDARAWDEERWLVEGSVLAFIAGGRVVQLAFSRSALAVDEVRRLVERGASVSEVAALTSA